jgi:hypothetical protein
MVIHNDFKFNMNSPGYIEMLRNGRRGVTKSHAKDIQGMRPEFQIYM